MALCESSSGVSGVYGPTWPGAEQVVILVCGGDVHDTRSVSSGRLNQGPFRSAAGCGTSHGPPPRNVQRRPAQGRQHGGFVESCLRKGRPRQVGLDDKTRRLRSLTFSDLSRGSDGRVPSDRYTLQPISDKESVPRLYLAQLVNRGFR